MYLKIVLLLQLCVALFVWYRAYKNKGNFWKTLDIRVFWGMALLFNAGGVCLSIYHFKCAASGQYDLVADEVGMEVCFLIIQTLVALIDALVIYFMTKEYWGTKRILKLGVYVSIIALLIIFGILVAPIYERHFIVLFLEINAMPLLLSVCVGFLGSNVRDTV